MSLNRKPPCETSNPFSLSLLILHPPHTPPLHRHPTPTRRPGFHRRGWIPHQPSPYQFWPLRSWEKEPEPDRGAQASGKWQWDAPTGPAPRLASTALILVRGLGFPARKHQAWTWRGLSVTGDQDPVWAFHVALSFPGLSCVNLYFHGSSCFGL